MSKVLYYIKYVGLNGQTFYVRQVGGFFSFVSSITSATGFASQAQANNYLSTVKKVNRQQGTLTVVTA